MSMSGPDRFAHRAHVLDVLRERVHVRDLHLDRLVALLQVGERLLDHPVAARAAETARAVDRDLRAVVAPEPMQRKVRALADRVPQRDVERRHRHAGDAAAPVGHGEIPEVLPDRFDGGRVLALHARDDHLLDEGRDRLEAGPKVKQVAHAGDAAGRFDIDDEDAAIRPECVALDPLRVGPGHAQDRHAHVADGHVGTSHRRFRFDLKCEEGRAL